jgi:hypothetical protein
MSRRTSGSTHAFFVDRSSPHQGKAELSKRPPELPKKRVGTADTHSMPSDSGNSLITTPPRIFLDTNHLINVACLRNGLPLPPGQSQEAYSFIGQCIQQHYGMIFCQTAPLDWVDGNATERSVRQIAQVIDSAHLKYLLEPDYMVYLAEVLSECHRLHPELSVPDLKVLHVMVDSDTHEPAELKIARLVPDYYSEEQQRRWAPLIASGTREIPFGSVQDHVMDALSWRQRNSERYHGRVDGFMESLMEDIEGRAEYFADSRRFHIGWLKGFLKVDKVIAACNRTLGEDEIGEILANLDFARCPSVQLYIKAREQRIRVGHPPADNDVDDWAILPAVTFADVALTDRAFRSFLLRADGGLASKVFHNAAAAVSALQA